MNEKTLKALKASIRHWERMAKGRPIRGEEPSGEYCALCKLFPASAYDHGCGPCPVMQRTGKCGCKGTPFFEAQYAFLCGQYSQKFQSAAGKELDFLKSLLPKGKR